MKVGNLLCCFVILIICLCSYELKIKIKDDNFVGENPDEAVSERLPSAINIKIENGDSDIVNMKRYEEEKEAIKSKLNFALSKFEKEKKNLMNIISYQNKKLTQLSFIVDTNNYILLKLINKLG